MTFLVGTTMSLCSKSISRDVFCWCQSYSCLWFRIMSNNSWCAPSGRKDGSRAGQLHSLQAICLSPLTISLTFLLITFSKISFMIKVAIKWYIPNQAERERLNKVELARVDGLRRAPPACCMKIQSEKQIAKTYKNCLGQ